MYVIIIFYVCVIETGGLFRLAVRMMQLFSANQR